MEALCDLVHERLVVDLKAKHDLREHHEVCKIRAQDLHMIKGKPFSGITVSASTLDEVTSVLNFGHFNKAGESGHIVIICRSIEPFGLHELAIVQEAEDCMIFPDSDVTESVSSCLQLERYEYTCLNLQHGQILIGPEKEGEDNIFVVICKAVSQLPPLQHTRRASSRLDSLLKCASNSTPSSSSPDVVSSSLSSPDSQIMAVQAEKVQEMANVVKYIMGAHAVSVNINLTFLEKANSITDKTLKINWDAVKSVLPYCKHSYMQLAQVRKLLNNLAHLATVFHTKDDILEFGLLYTHHIVFDMQRLFSSDSIENKLRYMKFRGVEQPNTQGNMSDQLQKFWPEESLLNSLVESVLEEARLDFFTVVNEIIMSVIWSQTQWQFKDLDQISLRMCMSRTSLCSSNAFLAINSGSTSPFTVLPLFVGVDVQGKRLLQGRDGAVHYIVNDIYTSLIEKTLTRNL
jgi:hypothetical protein